MNTASTGSSGEVESSVGTCKATAPVEEDSLARALVHMIGLNIASLQPCSVYYDDKLRDFACVFEQAILEPSNCLQAHSHSETTSCLLRYSPLIDPSALSFNCRMPGEEHVISPRSAAELNCNLSPLAGLAAQAQAAVKTLHGRCVSHWLCTVGNTGSSPGHQAIRPALHKAEKAVNHCADESLQRPSASHGRSEQTTLGFEVS